MYQWEEYETVVSIVTKWTYGPVHSETQTGTVKRIRVHSSQEPQFNSHQYTTALDAGMSRNEKSGNVVTYVQITPFFHRHSDNCLECWLLSGGSENLAGRNAPGYCGLASPDWAMYLQQDRWVRIYTWMRNMPGTKSLSSKDWCLGIC